MDQDVRPSELTPPYTSKLGARTYLRQVLHGVGATLGLAILWGLEVVRDAYFRLLDRLNVKPRRRRGSAFPPGQPRRRHDAA